MTVFGKKDATVLPGITDYNWMQLLAEVGTDLKKWKTEKHFTSWWGLAPKQHHSNKLRKNYKPKGKPKAGLIFKQAATSLLNSKKIALGAFGRKIRARKGPVLAIKAVARKLAELYWKLFVKGIKEYEQKILSALKGTEKILQIRNTKKKNYEPKNKQIIRSTLTTFKILTAHYLFLLIFSQKRSSLFQTAHLN
ncbi:hypothetical protein GCM10007103_29250 [Salinimicrobium marinum]|uniref:Transposase IS116/IS110/IS902 C-terminal domain-containing protein n=1 Tax=Salinimicrobium marinum TaxID=680283 RepID=A0A918W1B2_9FLAO|nr:transposase [Salinimicrobium marinum]GHA46296.1 hypothetical protein GCM10007103_29250 [Salinimicrobium marinum]